MTDDTPDTTTPMHPEDIAAELEHLSDISEKRNAFADLKDSETQAKVLSELEEETVAQILEGMPPHDVAALAQHLPDDDIADILGALPPERAQGVLATMRDDDAVAVEDLLKYPEESAGGIMTTECIALTEDVSVEHALDALQRSTDAEMIYYLYVIDPADRLVGVISLRHLLRAPRQTPLKHIMTPHPIHVATDTDQEEVARQVEHYNLLAIPVVDHAQVLVGIVTVDDVVDVIRQEDTEDMLRMSGTTMDADDPFMQRTSMGAARIRLPWLFTNLIGSVIAGYVLWAFRLTIQEVVALVTFIPIVSAMSGNVGLQSATLVIRGLATGHLSTHDLRRLCLREVRVAFLMGMVCGGAVLLISTLGPWQPMLGVVVGVSMLLAFLISAAIATATPLLLSRAGIDPAIAATPFVSTINDITSMSIYMTIATMLVAYLT